MRVLGVGAGVRALWRELSPAHRRWVYLNALVITALINLLVNAGIAWASLMGEHRVPLWSAPLVEKPSTVTDTVGTFFLLPLITCLLCTTAVWYDMARGKLPVLTATATTRALVASLPGTRLRRGLVLGALCTVALAPLSVLVLVTIDFAGLSTTQFVLYKAALGVALGAIVTPVIAVRAMADGPPRLPAAERARHRPNDRIMSPSPADSELDAWQSGNATRRYFVVDVFTDVPLEGNQLAVFTDPRGLSAEQLQRLAREMNFSETVFVLPPEREGDVRVRIFTPRHELPFAGHPALGCAFVVAEARDCDRVSLETGLGVIPVELEREDGRIVFGRMQQVVPEWGPYEREVELLAALGVERSGLPVEAYPNGPRHVYVELESEEAVAALRPNWSALAELSDVAANCFAGAGRSWKTRMFAPSGGVVEDPATGSAAGPLAIHLARHSRIAFGEEIEIRQGAEVGRPSVLYARAEGSGDRIDRVEVGGCAVIVARGEFRFAEPT